jgi:hypothetical protein
MTQQIKKYRDKCRIGIDHIVILDDSVKNPGDELTPDDVYFVYYDGWEEDWVLDEETGKSIRT